MKVDYYKFYIIKLLWQQKKEKQLSENLLREKQLKGNLLSENLLKREKQLRKGSLQKNEKQQKRENLQSAEKDNNLSYPKSPYVVDAWGFLVFMVVYLVYKRYMNPVRNNGY